jgi:Flavin containing amine oxidoreductase
VTVPHLFRINSSSPTVLQFSITVLYSIRCVLLTTSEIDADVIVVGGGAAGLSAAAVLEASGLRVLLLEGRQRLGGRVCASETGIDLGAQWIHGERTTTGPHPLLELARCTHLKIIKVDYENAVAYDSASGRRIPDKVIDAWERAWERLEKAIPTRTEPTLGGRVDALLQEMRLDAGTEAGVRHCLATFIETEFGVDGDWLCGRNYDEGEVLGSDHLLPAGLHSIVPVLVAALKTTRVVLSAVAMIVVSTARAW